MGTWTLGERAALTSCLATFGGVATFTPAGGSAEAVRVILDEGYRVTQIDSDGMPVNATQLRLTVRVSDLSRRPRREDKFTVGASTYLVDSVEDGTAGDAICVVQRIGG